jgi:hypothetical protein
MIHSVQNSSILVVYTETYAETLEILESFNTVAIAILFNSYPEF